MKTKERKQIRKTKQAVAEQKEEQAAPKFKQETPQEQLRRWIILRCKIEAGVTIYDELPIFMDSRDRMGDKTFMETVDIREVLKQVRPYEVVDILLDAAFRRYQSPYPIVDVMAYDGIIIDKISSYFNDVDPADWNLSFCELVAATVAWDFFRERIVWLPLKARARGNFCALVRGPISPQYHSSRLYHFLFFLFFQGRSETSSLFKYSEMSHKDQAKLMQGFIEQGKQGRFIWDFEDYLEHD